MSPLRLDENIHALWQAYQKIIVKSAMDYFSEKIGRLDICWIITFIRYSIDIKRWLLFLYSIGICLMTQ